MPKQKQYRIEHKVHTLVNLLFLENKEKPASFKFDGIEFNHCSFSHKNGWQKDEWNAIAIIEANTWKSAFTNFRQKLFSIIPKISFISQAYIDFRIQPFLVHKLENPIAVTNYAVDSKPVGLMFGKDDVQALTELIANKNIPKEFFSYWNDAVNTTGYSAKLLLMFSAIEALTKKPNGKPNYRLRENILGKQLKLDLFGDKNKSKKALRNRIVHGEYFSSEDKKNYVDAIHKQVIRYFNEHILSNSQISEDVINPQRHFFGNKKSWYGFVERLDKSNEFILDDILKDFENHKVYRVLDEVENY